MPISRTLPEPLFVPAQNKSLFADEPLFINAKSTPATADSSMNLAGLASINQRVGDATARALNVPTRSELAVQNPRLSKQFDTAEQFVGAFSGEPLGGKAPQVFKGFKDLSTKIVEHLKGKSTVSKQFISDLMKMPSIKQAEKDTLSKILADEADVVDVPTFANKVKTELLPLNVSKADGPMQIRYETVNLPDELRGPVADYAERIYESPIKTSAGNVHFSGFRKQGKDPEGYFAHTRIEDLPTNEQRSVLTNGKPTPKVEPTRRVIEIQSDLFQKGRLHDEAMGVIRKDREAFTYNDKPFEVLSRDPDAKIVTGRIAGGRETKIPLDDFEAQNAEKFSGLAKLEPYRNTWHERVIREEVKQAAKDGKTKLQFPTGETAMKIEGLGEGPRWMTWDITRGGYQADLKPENLQKVFEGGVTIKQGGQEWIITDVLGDGKFKAVQKRVADISEAEARNDYGLTREAYLNSNKETFDISGKVDTNNPIYRFYEKEVGKYLKNKYNAQLITDPQGVKWWELNVSKEQKSLPVEAFAAAPIFLTNKQNGEDRE